MSGTRRTPISRPPVAQVTARGVELFTAMGKLRCTCPSPRPPTQGPCPGCEQWYDLHDALHTELKLPPWQWPCVARQSPKRAGSTCWNDDIAARMAALKAAAKARRVTPSSQEGSPNEPVASPDTVTP
jgi:hypothetical protein